MTVAGIMPFPSAQAKLARIFINEHNMSSSKISKEFYKTDGDWGWAVGKSGRGRNCPAIRIKSVILRSVM